MIALLLTLAASAPCPGTTTLEINACLAGQLDHDEARMAKYLAAARKRVARETPEAIPGFDAAQTAWRGYRKAACDAVFTSWQGGTIRTAMEIGCERRLTRARTHDIWSDWLTYMDSTPPLLAEPPRESGK